MAIAERLFSKLKLKKSYLSSMMLQDRLAVLYILSIENDHAKQMDVDELVNILQRSATKRNSEHTVFN